MAWHLERHPGMRAVINWVPVLLDQLEDYADQFDSGKLRDPLLRLLARDEAEPLSAQERALVAERCLIVENLRMIQHYPHFNACTSCSGYSRRRGRQRMLTCRTSFSTTC